MQPVVFAVVSVVVSLGVVTAITVGALRWMHSVDVAVCATFSQETGFETKMVDYNPFFWDCMAYTRSGKWIPVDRLREMD